MQPQTLLLASLLAVAGMAAPADNTPELVRRSNFPIPSSKGSETFKSVKSIKGTFDGGMKTYGRGVSCTGQKEGGNKDAVFQLEDGAHLKNVIIGKDQIEGIHCMGSCTLENVWWSAVCEDALTLKGDGTATITGGGAQGADDKVIQHNGAGKVTIDGFTVSDFGKLYRSCGNCKQNGSKREVIIKDVKAYNGKSLAGINSNYGDTATFTNTCASSVKEVCVEYQGTNNNSKEPKKTHSGSSGHCKYSKVSSC